MDHAMVWDRGVRPALEAPICIEILSVCGQCLGCVDMDPDQADWTFAQIHDAGGGGLHRGWKSDAGGRAMLGNSRTWRTNSHTVRGTKSARGKRQGDGCSYT